MWVHIYTLIFFPIEQILEFCYLFAFRITKSPGLSIVGLSIAVNILILPIYLVAEKKKHAEQEILNRMKRKKERIKSVFKGDERYVMLSTLYRQHHYHPIYSLRNNIGLFVQIPVFIAAYYFLLNLEMMKGASFGPVADMGKPDSLLTVGNFSINLLPIGMTLISFVSTLIYSKDSSIKSDFPLYGIAIVFLVLLYNSPSGVVVYWTANIFFSLIRNCILETKRPKIIALTLYFGSCLFLTAYLLFMHKGWIVKRVFLVLFFILVPLFPFLCRLFTKLKQKVLALEKYNGRFKYKKLTLIIGTCFLLAVYLMLINNGKLAIRVFTACILIVIPFLPFLNSFLSSKNINLFTSGLNQENSKTTGIFVLSLFILFLLGGLFIPSTLIASSVQEFSFIKDDQSPFPFLFQTLIQSFGFFFLWPMCVYCIFSQNIKRIITKLTLVIVFMVVIDVFFFSGDYGNLTLQFELSGNTISDFDSIFLNLLIVVIFVIFALYMFQRFRKIMVSSLAVVICTLLLLVGINTKTIYSEFQSYKLQRENDKVFSNEPVFRFSRTGKNVLVIMLDQFISGYIPYIFEEKPKLHNSFNGFAWYKNTVSFGQFTNFGTPGLFGGYGYAPLEMQARSDTLLKDKHNEALLLLPRIFLDHGFNVTVADPSYANYSDVPDLSIYQGYPLIKAENIIGKYNRKWLVGKENLFIIANAAEIINYYLIRFSYFKFTPLLFRNFFYDHGNWLVPGDRKGSNGIPQQTLDNYIALDILPEITVVNESGASSFNALVNLLPHFPFFLQVPDYILPCETTEKGDGPFSDKSDYHVNTASLLMLGKWFDFLKENGVYDNSRIIIVADHGRDYHNNLPYDIFLPNRTRLGFLPTRTRLVNYHALLMVKDFYAQGNMIVNDTFMTNADVPLLALEGIVENPVNPFTGKVLTSDKEDGVTITSSQQWQPKKDAYSYDIKPNEWLHVHTNIFDIKNWNAVTIEE